MKKLLALMLFIGVSACNSPCDQPGSPATLLSSGIASTWGCNQAAVQADIDNWLSSKNLCQAPTKPTGPIGGIICPLVFNNLQAVAGKSVPAAWKCDPTKVGANAASALNMLCSSLIPF